MSNRHVHFADEPPHYRDRDRESDRDAVEAAALVATATATGDQGDPTEQNDSDLPPMQPLPTDISGLSHLEVQTPISRFLLEDLEEDARRLADSVQLMMGGLTLKLHALSAISLQYIQTHAQSAEALGQSVDASLDMMSALIVKCQQVSENMPPVEDLMVQIKRVKRSLDTLEAVVAAKSAGVAA